MKWFNTVDRLSQYIYQNLARRHKRVGFLHTPSQADIKAKLSLYLDIGICGYCYRPLYRNNASPDHTIPLCRGGSPSIDNIEFVCLPCNYAKQRRTGLEFEASNPRTATNYPRLPRVLLSLRH